MCSLLVEMYLCTFTYFVSRASLLNKMIGLLYACTPTSISYRIFVFEHFLHTFLITLIFDVEMFVIFIQNYIYLLCFNL
jgi:hypothetical protein